MIINQSVTASPFDVQALRQISYDRNRLMKDCRPQLVTALNELLAESGPLSQPGRVENPVATPPPTGVLKKSVHIDSEFVAQLQAHHLRLQFANQTHDTSAVEAAARDILNLLDRVSFFDGADPDDLRNLSAVVGNCGVELEKGHFFQEAEDVYKRGIAMCPTLGGIHLQYADFLVDRGRVQDALVELDRARDLVPNDGRLRQVELKIALRRGGDSPGAPDLKNRLREDFEKDKKNSRAAAAYLMYLSRSGAPMDEFMRVCAEWEQALPPKDRMIARRALADQLAISGNHKEAIRCYEELMNEVTGENRAHALHNLATLYFHTDQRERALECWGEAYQFDSSVAEIRSSYSQALAVTGDIENAMRVSTGQPYVPKAPPRPAIRASASKENSKRSKDKVRDASASKRQRGIRPSGK